MDDVTVVIPFLRGGNKDWLQQTIDSFPKGTPYLVMENDGEMADALNEGIRQATTEFVLPFGADDVATPGMLEMLRSLIWDVDVAYPSMLLTDEELRPFGVFRADPFCSVRLQTWNFVSGGSLIRREKLLEVGGWRDLQTLEDWDLFVRLFRGGAKFKPVPEAFFLYRQVANSRNRQGMDGDFKARWQREIVGTVPEAIATFYYQDTPATTYVRCQLPARHLPARCLPEINVDLAEDQEISFPEHEGAAILQFAGDATWALMQEGLQQEGFRVLVETDDNYLVSSRQRKRAGWGFAKGDSIHTLSGHKSIVQRADGVIVTTPHLAKQYERVNENVYVCPNQIDPDDWEFEKPDDGVFRVGWFASRSHQDDTKLVFRALEWASRQPDVEVVTMGFDPGWKFKRRHIPWSQDLSTYRAMMFQLDVGLGPVVPNPWSVCRSDLKAIEYGMAGALPILSQVPPYDGWEERAPMATSAKEFWRQVQWAVQNRTEVQEQAARVNDYVMTERTAEKNAWRWKIAIGS